MRGASLEDEIVAMEQRLAKAKMIASDEKEKWKEAMSPGKHGTHWNSARVRRAKLSFREIPPDQWTKKNVAEWLKDTTLVDAANVNKLNGKEMLGASPSELKQHFETGILRRSQWTLLLGSIAKLRKPKAVELPSVHSPIPKKRTKEKPPRKKPDMEIKTTNQEPSTPKIRPRTSRRMKTTTYPCWSCSKRISKDKAREWEGKRFCSMDCQIEQQQGQQDVFGRCTTAPATHERASNCRKTHTSSGRIRGVPAQRSKNRINFKVSDQFSLQIMSPTKGAVEQSPVIKRKPRGGLVKGSRFVLNQNKSFSVNANSLVLDPTQSVANDLPKYKLEPPAQHHLVLEDMRLLAPIAAFLSLKSLCRLSCTNRKTHASCIALVHPWKIHLQRSFGSQQRLSSQHPRAAIIASAKEVHRIVEDNVRALGRPEVWQYVSPSLEIVDRLDLIISEEGKIVAAQTQGLIHPVDPKGTITDAIQSMRQGKTVVIPSSRLRLYSATRRLPLEQWQDIGSTLAFSMDLSSISARHNVMQRKIIHRTAKKYRSWLLNSSTRRILHDMARAARRPDAYTQLESSGFG